MLCCGYEAVLIAVGNACLIEKITEDSLSIFICVGIERSLFFGFDLLFFFLRVGFSGKFHGVNRSENGVAHGFKLIAGCVNIMCDLLRCGESNIDCFAVIVYFEMNLFQIYARINSTGVSENNFICCQRNDNTFDVAKIGNSCNVGICVISGDELGIRANNLIEGFGCQRDIVILIASVFRIVDEM